MRKIYYTIGDVHGERALLNQLLNLIATDFSDRSDSQGTIVFLGDYVDRGVNSAGVVERIMELSRIGLAGMNSFAIRGNHEQMLVNACRAFAFGDVRMGEYTYHHRQHGATINSYGGDFKDVSKSHLKWMSKLPVIVRDEEQKLIFVHGGFDPEFFPEVTEEELMWSRYKKFFDSNNWPSNPDLDGYTVLHGHTVTRNFKGYQDARRVNCDSGAVFGGELTAAVMVDGKFDKFISVKNWAPAYRGG